MISFESIEVNEAEAVDEPVSVDEAKDWAKIDYSDDDAVIEDMITGTREDIEQHMSIKLVAASVIVEVETTEGNDKLFYMPWAFSVGKSENLTVNRLNYGQDDQELTEGSDYYKGSAIAFPSCGRYRLQYDVNPDVPKGIQEAIKMLVAYRYNNRGDQEKQQGIPEDIEAKVQKYAAVWL